MNYSADLVERFWGYVRKETDCWIWTGGLNRYGHGQFVIAYKQTLAVHRFSYQLHFGAIPEGMYVRHKCNDLRCVRPDHLFLAAELTKSAKEASGEG